MGEMNERIREVRREAGLSQREFADRVGITGSSINKLETGENNPSERTLRLISSAFHVNYEWLRYGEGRPVLAEASPDEIVDEIMTGSNEHAKSVMRDFARAMDDEGWRALRVVLDKLKSAGL